MSLVQAIILGLIQGLTEFLPVSSSGHLVIIQTFFNLFQPPILFDTLVHLGTLIAVIIFFRSDILKLTTKKIKLIIIATLPAVVVGLFLDPIIKSIFNSLTLVAISLLFTAALLLITQKFSLGRKTINHLSLLNAITIGIFQAIAILPGVSRSGSTISAGMFAGLKKQDAFSFSFLLSIPAIIGALILQLKDTSELQNSNFLPSIFGMITAAITGFFALQLLKITINRFKFHYFAYYCFFLSLTLFSYLAFTSH